MANLKEDLKIVISGDPSKFNKALKEAEQSTKRLEAGLSSAAKISGVAFAALSATVFGLVREFRDGEQAAKQLETTLISTGRSSQFTTSQLETMALALQDVTTFTDDSIMAAQQAILTFSKIGKTKESFDQITAASLDLATRMGTDAVSAAKLLGQSLQEPEMAITRLRKAGVAFTDAQALMIADMAKSGNAAKAQSIILDQVAKSTGGAAQTAATGTGAFIQAIFQNMEFDQIAKLIFRQLKDKSDFLPEVVKELDDDGFEQEVTLTGPLKIMRQMTGIPEKNEAIFSVVQLIGISRPMMDKLVDEEIERKKKVIAEMEMTNQELVSQTSSTESPASTATP